MKYYVFIAADNVIWSAGYDKEDVIKEAKDNIDSYIADEGYSEDIELMRYGKVVEATEQLVNEVNDFGWYDDMFKITFKNGKPIAQLNVCDKTNWYDKIKNIEPIQII